MIVTTAQLAAALGEAENPNMERAVRAADGFAKRYCSRPFERDQYVETVTGFGTDRIYVREPISEIISVEVEPYGDFASGTLYTDVSGFLFAEQMIVWRNGFFYAGRNTSRITYIGGYWPYDDADPDHEPKMPAEVFDAVMKMAAQTYKRGFSERNQSESLGQYSYTRDTSRPFDDTIFASLDPYKRMYV